MAEVESDRQLRSRQTLTQLLQKQIDRNEQLQAENYQLQDEQRRLLSIIQTKIQEIGRLQENSKPLSDSTLEATMMRDGQERVATLERIVGEKEQEIQKLRAYYAQVIDKISQQSSLQGGLAQEQLEAELRRSKQEVQSLHESIMRSNERVREISQELISTEKELEEMRRNEGTIREYQQEIIELRDKVNQHHNTKEQELLSLQVAFQEKISKQKWEYEETIGRLKREGEERISAEIASTGLQLGNDLLQIREQHIFQSYLAVDLTS